MQHGQLCNVLWVIEFKIYTFVTLNFSNEVKNNLFSGRCNAVWRTIIFASEKMVAYGVH